MTLTRRQILQTGMLGSMASLPAARVLGQASQGALEWVPVVGGANDGVALIRGAGSNVLVNWGSDGVALVDGGHADYASSLLREVSDRLGGVPELLFNTHCHRDQIGCNAALGTGGEATIVAHEYTRLWLTTEIISRWEGRVYEPLPEFARPNKTFIYDEQNLQFNESMQYGHLRQAHTDGDIYVFFPERNILFAGGVVTPGSYPVVDYSTNGWVGGIADGLRTLLGIADSDTRIFASTGGEVRREDLEVQLDMLLTVIEQMGANVYSGGTFEEFVATNPSAEFDALYGDPSLFLYTAYESVWGHTGDVRRYRRA